jgi:hypothetical protein
MSKKKIKVALTVNKQLFEHQVQWNIIAGEFKPPKQLTYNLKTDG